MKSCGEFIFSARVSFDFSSLIFSNIIIVHSVLGPENLKTDGKNHIFSCVLQIVLI